MFCRSFICYLSCSQKGLERSCPVTGSAYVVCYTLSAVYFFVLLCMSSVEGRVHFSLIML